MIHRVPVVQVRANWPPAAAESLIACGTVEGETLLIDQATDCYRAALALASNTSRPQMPIPADYDPEQERRRLRQGGCCGEPSKD